MAIAILNKAILKISGDNAKELLNGLTTQDMNLISTNKPIYTLFLNNKGRVLYSAIIYMLNNTTFALEIEPELLMDLAKHIHKHDITKKIEFNQETELSIAITDANSANFYPDPRHTKLPFRGLVKASEQNTKLLEKYENLRLELAIPENYDFIREKSLANDLNAEQLNAVSFSKGCYLGQELTSRTKHIKESKNQLVCLKNNNKAISENMVIYNQNDEKVGQTFSYNSKFVLAIIKRGIKTDNLIFK